MAGNKNLASAKANKKDEFYTQPVDIENELKHYKPHFVNAKQATFDELMAWMMR